MDFLLRLCVLIFLNLFVHTNAQDLLSAILGGIQSGLKVFNNNLDVGHRDYPDYQPLPNREVGFTRSNDISESNQNHNYSEEPDNSNYEQRQRGDSNWNSEENDKENLNSIENKKRISVNDLMINYNQQNRSHTKQPGLFNENIQLKPIIGQPLPLEKEAVDKNISMTHNKDKLKSHNVATNNKNGSGTKSIPLVVPVNGTVSNNNIPGLLVKDSLLKQNKKNSKDTKHPEKDKKVKKDKCKNVLKPLKKRKFYFQARPVIPLSEEDSTNELIYYVD